jgi:hypothetical protein
LKGLVYVAGLPEDEAERIGETLTSEWSARGGVLRGRWEGQRQTRVTDVVLTTLVMALVGSLIVGVVVVVTTLVA